MAIDPLLGGEIMSGGMPPKKPAAKKPAVRKAGCGCKL